MEKTFRQIEDDEMDVSLMPLIYQLMIETIILGIYLYFLKKKGTHVRTKLVFLIVIIFGITLLSFMTVVSSNSIPLPHPSTGEPYGDAIFIRQTNSLKASIDIAILMIMLISYVVVEYLD